MNPSDQKLSESAVQWVVDAINPEAIVLSAQRLQGGISALVHRVSLSINGERQDVVLRQFDNAEWVREQPDLAAREAASLLRAFRTVDVRTPSLIAFDETGSRCGKPAVLMTLLAGEVVLEPADSAQWLNGMAKALCRIHEVEASDFDWTYASYCDAASLDTSSWSKHPDKWKAAADIVTSSRPPATMRFIHRDYHPANVLWSGGEVSGIVDWVNGCIGPAGIDVGHCRVNLALLHGVPSADEFLAGYRRHAGESFTYDPYWDLVTLIDFAYGPPPEVYGGWTALGVTGLTDEMMAERLDDYLLSLLNCGHFTT
ncbi:aminoglycoside phosphotransferase family protein [Cohnella endophytica]|uniref:Aminoglycoside phosphotransferase family protein n=1 Tax=Cohnella endophytica TaxID=2419778 RepID=A0A494XBQ6_9BACL|nr:aminoglycoside phosphotransferase family protein [Cohnella endophytica]RKP47958.1 aminoglycoside phosphotransferase family protein [Cohnella endophytica]